MYILNLPVDIVLLCLPYLTIDDVYALRAVCYQLNQLTHLKSVWYSILQTHILDKGIPFLFDSPTYLNGLSSSCLERAVMRAHLNRLNWTSPSPRAYRQLEIRTKAANPNVAPHGGPTLAIKLLNRGSHPYLLSASLQVPTATDMRLVLECWDIEKMPVCVARCTMPWYGGVLFNSDAAFPAYVAVRGQEEVIIFTLDISNHSFRTEFVPFARVPTRCSRLIRFSGDLLLVVGEKKHSLLNVRRKGWVVHLANPSSCDTVSPGPNPDDCYEAVIADEYLVLLRTHFLAIYPLQSFRHGLGSSLTSTTELSPVSWHIWGWSLDGGRISHRVRHSQTRAEPLLDVVVRFSSDFPWPPNILNHYILQPNPAYVASSPIQSMNLPYDAHPVHMRTLSAPLRLFTQSDVAIGTYGTVLWIDTHTEEYFMQSATGQRLAGVSLPSTVPDAVNPDVVAYSAGSESVYNIHEQNSWCVLALDEPNGRVALGALDGIISIMDFAWPSL